MAKNGLPEKILIVDDDQMVLNSVVKMLANYGVKVVTAKDLSSALYRFNQERFEVAIAELEFEELPGTVLIQKWQNHELSSKAETAFVISSGLNKGSAEEALMTEMGNITPLTKPVKQGQLLSVLSNCLKIKNQKTAISKLQREVIEPLIKQGNVDKAVSVAEKKLKPLGRRGAFLTALVHDEAKQHVEAINILEKLAKEDSSNMSYINELARISTELGDLDKATEYYEKADKIAPKNLQRLNEMASLYLSIKEPEKSVEKFKEILELSPEKPDLKFEIYGRLFDSGFEQHAVDFAKQTSTPRELIRHYNNKGVTFSKKEDFEKAINEYKRAVDLLPGNKELYRILYNMAIAHINKKTLEDIKLAHGLLNRCLEIKPDYDKAKEKLKITSRYVKSEKAS